MFCPTPVPLKELSAIAISLEIWRCRLMEFRSSDSASLEFNQECDGQHIASLNVLPDLPSVIYDVIAKYFTEFGLSLTYWLHKHHRRAFYFHYDCWTDVLKHFNDFVCDDGGRIDYTCTAERMMHCDEFNLQLKFIIACTYCFEDDIRRLWPSVSSSFNLNDINFDKTPQLYYWICCLRNELDKIPLSEMNNNIDEVMLNEFMLGNRQSLEYFWNRIPLENRMEKAVDLFKSGYDVRSLLRVILSKFTYQQLDEFINERRCDLMSAVFNDTRYDRYMCGEPHRYYEDFSLAIWSKILHIVNESVFTNQVRRMLQAENEQLSVRVIFRRDFHNHATRKHWSHLCCEMWNSTPEKLKRAAVRDITSADDILFSGIPLQAETGEVPPLPKEFKFLSTFLSCASSEQRRTFWYGNWRHLIYDTRCEDFKKILYLCLENDDAINEFGKNELANNQYFRHLCSSYLKKAYCKGLNEFVSIAWPEVEAARNFKLQLLQSDILDEQRLIIGHFIGSSRQFDEFVCDTYNDINLAENFKARLVSSRLIQEQLAAFSIAYAFEEFMQFIDAFVKNEQTLLQLKKRIVDHLKDRVIDYKYPPVVSILSWCLGSEEEVTKFQLEYAKDDLNLDQYFR